MRPWPALSRHQPGPHDQRDLEREAGPGDGGVGVERHLDVGREDDDEEDRGGHGALAAGAGMDDEGGTGDLGHPAPPHPERGIGQDSRHDPLVLPGNHEVGRPREQEEPGEGVGTGAAGGSSGAAIHAWSSARGGCPDGFSVHRGASCEALSRVGALPDFKCRIDSEIEPLRAGDGVNLKEQFERHPIGSGLLIFISGVSVATGSIWPLLNSRADNARDKVELEYQKKLVPLETALNSIERQVGGEKDLLPVESLIIDPADAGSVPAASKFIQQDKFYALEPDQGAGWAYSQTTELAVAAELIGIAPEELPDLLGVSREALTQIPVYLWRHADVKAVSGVEGLAKLPTQVMVQRLPFSALGLLADAAADQQAPTESGGSLDLSDLEALYRGDATGQVLRQELLLSMGLSDPAHTATSLSSVEKRGNVVYARIETTLKDVTVAGTRYEEYYFDRELIFISGHDEVFLVKTIVPSVDHRSPQATFINTWLLSLRVLVK